MNSNPKGIAEVISRLPKITISSNNKISIEKKSFNQTLSKLVNEKSTCVICYENEIIKEDLLDCQHGVCSECLSHLRKVRCPICRRPLEGKIVDNKVIEGILRREDEDRGLEETANFLVAAALFEDPNVNTEDLYGRIYQQII